MKTIIGILAVVTFSAVSAAAEEASDMVSVTQIIANGGWAMIVLVGLSIISVFMIVYFFFTLRSTIIMPDAFCLEAEGIATDGDVERLHALCEENGSIGAGIIGAAARLLRDNPDADYLVIRSVIEDEGRRQSSVLWQKIQYLMDISIAAPMVGLLGTVLGMIQAFVGLQEDFGAVKPIALSSGVSKALVTTAGGLILGIFCMLFYSYFRGHVNQLITRLEERCNDVLHRFIFRKEPKTLK